MCYKTTSHLSWVLQWGCQKHSAPVRTPIDKRDDGNLTQIKGINDVRVEEYWEHCNVQDRPFFTSFGLKEASSRSHVLVSRNNGFLGILLTF